MICRYRVQSPMMVLAFRDNHQAATTIPAGRVVEVIGPVEADDRFVVVRIDGEQFHAFASDLEQRAKKLRAANAANVSAA